MSNNTGGECQKNVPRAENINIDNSSALVYLKLRSSKCPKQKALDFSKRKHCKTDSTISKSGPKDFQILEQKLYDKNSYMIINNGWIIGDPGYNLGKGFDKPKEFEDQETEVEKKLNKTRIEMHTKKLSDYKNYMEVVNSFFKNEVKSSFRDVTFDQLRDKSCEIVYDIYKDKTDEEIETMDGKNSVQKAHIKKMLAKHNRLKNKEIDNIKLTYSLQKDNSKFKETKEDNLHSLKNQIPHVREGLGSNRSFVVPSSRRLLPHKGKVVNTSQPVPNKEPVFNNSKFSNSLAPIHKSNKTQGQKPEDKSSSLRSIKFDSVISEYEKGIQDTIINNDVKRRASKFPDSNRRLPSLTDNDFKNTQEKNVNQIHIRSRNNSRDSGKEGSLNKQAPKSNLPQTPWVKNSDALHLMNDGYKPTEEELNQNPAITPTNDKVDGISPNGNNPNFFQRKNTKRSRTNKLIKQKTIKKLKNDINNQTSKDASRTQKDLPTPQNNNATSVNFDFNKNGIHTDSSEMLENCVNKNFADSFNSNINNETSITERNYDRIDTKTSQNMNKPKKNSTVSYVIEESSINASYKGSNKKSNESENSKKSLQKSSRENTLHCSSQNSADLTKLSSQRIKVTPYEDCRNIDQKVIINAADSDNGSKNSKSNSLNPILDGNSKFPDSDHSLKNYSNKLNINVNMSKDVVIEDLSSSKSKRSIPRVKMESDDKKIKSSMNSFSKSRTASRRNSRKVSRKNSKGLLHDGKIITSFNGDAKKRNSFQVSSRSTPKNEKVTKNIDINPLGISRVHDDDSQDTAVEDTKREHMLEYRGDRAKLFKLVAINSQKLEDILGDLNMFDVNHIPFKQLFNTKAAAKNVQNVTGVDVSGSYSKKMRQYPQNTDAIIATSKSIENRSKSKKGFKDKESKKTLLNKSTNVRNVSNPSKIFQKKVIEPKKNPDPVKIPNKLRESDNKLTKRLQVFDTTTESINKKNSDIIIYKIGGDGNMKICNKIDYLKKTKRAPLDHPNVTTNQRSQDKKPKHDFSQIGKNEFNTSKSKNFNRSKDPPKVDNLIQNRSQNYSRLQTTKSNPKVNNRSGNIRKNQGKISPKDSRINEKPYEKIEVSNILEKSKEKKDPQKDTRRMRQRIDSEETFEDLQSAKFFMKMEQIANDFNNSNYVFEHFIESKKIHNLIENEKKRSDKDKKNLDSILPKNGHEDILSNLAHTFLNIDPKGVNLITNELNFINVMKNYLAIDTTETFLNLSNNPELKSKSANEQIASVAIESSEEDPAKASIEGHDDQNKQESPDNKNGNKVKFGTKNEFKTVIEKQATLGQKNKITMIDENNEIQNSESSCKKVKANNLINSLNQQAKLIRKSIDIDTVKLKNNEINNMGVKNIMKEATDLIDPRDAKIVKESNSKSEQSPV